MTETLKNRKAPMLRQTVLAAALVSLAIPALADFPREGVADVPNGIADPFVGTWCIGFPEGEGMINGDPLVTCDDPVELKAAENGDLVYVSPTGQEVTFGLEAFAGRTSWIPEYGNSALAVWTSPDAFFSHTVHLQTGKANWDDPRVYRRCED